MDWTKTITELLESGWTYRRLSERTGAGIATLHDLKSGKTTETMYELGVKLVALHKRATRKGAGKLASERKEEKKV